MVVSELTCFKAYDIRGKVGHNIDENVAYRIGKALAQHLHARTVVIGFDARETSPLYAKAVAQGINDAGRCFGYWHVRYRRNVLGSNRIWCLCWVEITASHNPIEYNGMKIVKAGSQPLDEVLDFKAIKALAESQDWKSVNIKGNILDYSTKARSRYVDCILKFINIKNLKPLKIVINSETVQRDQPST